MVHSPAERLAARFDVDQWPEFEAGYNIAPGQPIWTIRAADDHATRLAERRNWGLVPGWAKDPAIGSRLVNARGETLAEKPAFRAAFKRRRCLVPADGFYEWRRSGKQRVPFYFHPRDDRPFAMAGLFETWTPPEGDPIDSVTIVTVAANQIVGAVHHRMPAVLDDAAAARWLEEGVEEREALEPLLAPAPDRDWLGYSVDRRVNRPDFDEPACIERSP